MILAASLHERSLPLRRPLVTGRFTLSARDLVFLELRDRETNLTGWGEAAPLPAFGTESLDACRATLAHLASALNRGALPEELLASMLHPAARMALDLAWRDLQARAASLSLAACLGAPSVRDAVPVNALLAAVPTETLKAEARAAVDFGYTCLKMKIGARDGDEDLRRVQAVRTAVGPDILLRLDANGAWNLDEARRMVDRLESVHPEYVEQPVLDTEELLRLSESSPLPLAADESASSPEAIEVLVNEGRFSAIILKPMVLGGLDRALVAAAHASRAGMDVVVTSLLDSALARTACAHLAAGLTSSRHHGLATGDLFTEDLPGPCVDRGVLPLSSAPGIGVTLSPPHS